MKTKVIFTIIALSCSFIFSQKKVADKFFDKFAYIKASELYEESFEKGDDSEHVLTRLADCYYNNSNSEKSAFWLEKAVNKYPKINPEYIFKYIQSLRSLGKYDQANQWLDRFKELQKDDRRIKEFESLNASLFEDLTSTEGKYIETKNLPSNSEYSEFGTYMHNGKIFFASSKISEEGGKKKLYKWNEQPFLDIYEGEISSSESDSISNVGPIASDEINTDFHEASIAITNDGSTMYFTRDNITKKKAFGF